MSSNLRIGIIGCGHWGTNHVRNFRSVEGSEVALCADPDAGRLARIEKLFPGTPVTQDSAALIAGEDIDAVVIAVPTLLHFDLCKAALQAGKHVLCEKPLTLASCEARTLVGIAAQMKRVLMVGHVFLFNSGIRYMRKAVEDGVVGSVYLMRAVRTNLGPIRSDAGAAWDLAPHDISIFNYVLGRRPIAVSATGSCYLQPDVEDVVFTTLDYGDSIQAGITASWLDPKKIRQISLVGSEKMITWDDLASSGPICVYDRKVVQEPFYDDFAEFRLLAQDGDVTIPRLQTAEPLSLEAESFLAACRDGTIGLCSGAEGAEVVEILEAIHESVSTGGSRVEVRYGE